MKQFAKNIFAALALTMAAPALAQDIIVVAHGHADDPFWAVVKNGADAAGADSGMSVDFRAPEIFDMVAMSQLIDAAVNENPEGIVVSIPDAAALGPSIERAVASGIPVISINSGAEASKDFGALLHIGQGEYDAGKAAGMLLAAKGGTSGLCVNQEVGNIGLDLRCEGFADGFAEGAAEGIERDTIVLPTTSHPEEILAKVSAVLAADDSIDTILALSAATAGEPVVAAVKASGRDIAVASFDLSSNFLQSILDGDAVFAVDQQQFLQGYLSVSFLALHSKYGLMPGGDVPSGPNFITADTVEQVIELTAQGIR